MSKYRITLEGKTYEMEIEMISGNAASQPVPVTKEKKPAQNAVTASAPCVSEEPEQKPAQSASGVVAAPMPGTVLRIVKAEGEAVKNGEVVLVLEAMKMENEILAPADGTVRKMNCTEGGTVAGGEVLFEIG